MARTRNQGSKWIRPEKRWAIYLRDGCSCMYCGKGLEHLDSPLTLDHVKPCELGGSNSERNLVTACRSCNSSKQDLPLADFLAVLRDQGVDTNELAGKIASHTRRSIDRKAGAAMLRNRI